MKEKVVNSAKKLARKKTRNRVLKIILVIIVLFLINLYIVLRLMYIGENFTVTLDSEYGRESGLVVYEDPNDIKIRTYLKSEPINYFTDISVNWLPQNIDNEGNGSHNGQNYIAYTFYASNKGQDTINYWATIEIEDVIKNVDEAIRVMVIKNGERTIYAKKNKSTGNAENNTQPFYSDNVIMLEKNENFQVDSEDKYTIVIWVEGDDPDCIDELIGGEIKMNMRLTEEHINLENN
jgi:hypothetical protein